MNVVIAYGLIDYEGRDTIGVFASMMAATYRCIAIEERRAEDDDFDCYFNDYVLERWKVGDLAPKESLFFTRSQMVRPDRLASSSPEPDA